MLCNMYQILREIISLKSPEKILFVIFQFLRWDRFLLCFGTLHLELSCMIKNKKYIDAGVKDARMIDYTSKIYVILQQALIHNKILSNCEEFVKSNILELFETYSSFHVPNLVLFGCWSSLASLEKIASYYITLDISKAWFVNLCHTWATLLPY